METITVLKKEALTTIQVGTGFVERLHKLLVTLVSSLTEDQIKEFQAFTTTAQGQENPAPQAWMEDILTVSALLQSIEEAAVKQGNTMEKPADAFTQPGS